MRSKLQSLLLVTSLICLFITGPVNASGKVSATNQSTNRNTTNSNACPDNAKSTKANSGNSRAQSCIPPSINTYGGTPQAALSGVRWGQTFTIPNGFSGQIDSISNIKLGCTYASAEPVSTQTADVIIYKLSDPNNLESKNPVRFISNLELNPCSPSEITPYDPTQAKDFTLTFPAIGVSSGEVFYVYLENTSSTKAYSFFFFEVPGNTYSGGQSYRQETIWNSFDPDPYWDLAMKVNLSSNL